MANFGVVVFPGSNCDHDCYHVIKHVFDQGCEFVWHEERNLEGLDCVILPGGFSYGDYLRTGAIARFSPVMRGVEKFAKSGGLVIGICNGFQILVEAGLLPGALIRNTSLKFVCKWVNILVQNNNTPFTNLMKVGDILRIPVAHGDGNYFAHPDDVRKLNQNSQVVFRYCDEKGRTTLESNPNGSIENIAGICNPDRNILGMMPHPERCSEEILGGKDGRPIFESIISWLEKPESKGEMKTYG
ncbi:MAG TPA: phosphoribosylformylglycinamidine synthase subunit PurQ [Thermodesulfobacteriota bacterium]|nr:phosphoribosylformylglycinamidine synthase subunit PurQ [Thermodesulfobacteriota bacterium]